MFEWGFHYIKLLTIYILISLLFVNDKFESLIIVLDSLEIRYDQVRIRTFDGPNVLLLIYVGDLFMVNCVA